MTTASAARPHSGRADRERLDFAALWDAPLARVEELFLGGTTPQPSEIAGWEYQGANLARVAPLLRIRRFTKGFLPLAGGVSGAAIIDGYNVWVEQEGGPRDGWIPLVRHGKPWRHGFYQVVSVDRRALDSRYTHALLIDYGLGTNPWHHPARLLRDYVVQVYPDDPTLLVGKAYVALGRLRVFGGHFVMRRAAPASREG